MVWCGVSVWQRDLRTNACTNACVPTCQMHANFLLLRAKLPYGVPMFQLDVPTSHMVCQFFNLACQNLSQREISILYYYIKRFYIMFDIIVIHIIFISIVRKNCIILHFISYHVISKKSVWNFSFLLFFPLLLFS